MTFYIELFFYPRPDLASGCCRCLCPSVRPSVCPVLYRQSELTKLTRPDFPHVVGLFILRDVRHQVCPRDNSSPVQARITKFGPKMQNNLVKVLIIFFFFFFGGGGGGGGRGNRPWPSWSNSGSKSKFTPFWACLHHNSSPIQARITKFGPEVQNTLVEIPVV